MARTPIRKPKLPDLVERGALAPNGKPGHGKVRLRKNQGAKNALDLSPEIRRVMREKYDADVQWVLDSVLGKGDPAMRQEFEINAWEPIHQNMFDGLFDGLYMKKGDKGEINYGGLVLMWRPYDLTIEARNEQIMARNDALRAQEAMIKGGAAIQGLSPGFEAHHETVRNRFDRAVGPPMDIPQQ